MACMCPVTIKNPAADWDLTALKFMPVPCGKCPECLSKRSNGWIFRLLEQDKVSENSLFCTFTYENKYFTRESGRLTEKGFMTLVKRDFQLFMKRLRKSTTNGKIIKYYAVGEYGSSTFRPHYHAIIFNSSRGDIEKAWGLGNVHCDVVNGNTVAYTTKYMHKGRLIPLHSNDDRTPEFQLFSKGLGLSYINEQTIAYHNADLSRQYLTAEGGVKIPMPRIYRNRLFSDSVKKKLARRVQILVLEKKQQAMDEYKSRTGSIDGYYKSVAESKTAAINSFKDRQRSRNKM